MNSPNTSSEVDKKAFKQLSGVLERMYYDVKKGLSDLRPYERQIKAIFRKRQDYETHQSEIKGRISELEAIKPPEQYKYFAKISGHEQCVICGFNSEVFRKHLTDRLQALKQPNGDK